jgi:hypothetical protein
MLRLAFVCTSILATEGMGLAAVGSRVEQIRDARQRCSDALAQPPAHRSLADCNRLVDLPLAWLIEDPDRPGSADEAHAALSLLDRARPSLKRGLDARIATSSAALMLWIAPEAAIDSFAHAKKRAASDATLKMLADYGQGVAELRASHASKAKESFEVFLRASKGRRSIVLAGSATSLEPAITTARAAIEAKEPKPCTSNEECDSGEKCSTVRGACGRPPGCGPSDICADVCYGVCER